MINFIVYDNNRQVVKDVLTIIDKVMFNHNFNYEKHHFFNYNTLKRVVNKSLSNKIYILGISRKNSLGITAALKIRQSDLNSVIIFLSAQPEKSKQILERNLLIFTSICKNNIYENRLKSSLNKALLFYDFKPKLVFKKNGMCCNIPFHDICYIYRDKIKRCAIIKTEYGDFHINRSLKALLDELGDNFSLAHRSCIVNINKIKIFNKKRREIIFSSDVKTNVVNNKFFLK